MHLNGDASVINHRCSSVRFLAKSVTQNDIGYDSFLHSVPVLLVRGGHAGGGARGGRRGRRAREGGRGGGRGGRGRSRGRDRAPLWRVDDGAVDDDVPLEGDAHHLVLVAPVPEVAHQAGHHPLS